MKKKRSIISILMVSLICFFTSAGVYAASDTSWYINNAAILSNHSVVADIFRWIGQNLIALLCQFAALGEELFDKTFGLLDLTNYSKINNIIDSLKPVLAAVTVLCLVLLGIVMIVKREKKEVVKNILLGILAVSCSTYIFATANSLTKSFKGAILNNAASKSEAYNIVNQNVIDLVGIDKAGSISNLNYSSGVGVKYTAGITTKQSLNEIDFTEVLNWKVGKRGQYLYEWSDTFNELIRYKMINVNGKYLKAEVYKGILRTGVGNEFYYRYSFDFWSCILQILGLLVIYFALSYKNVRVAYELIVSRIAAFMYAADIGNGERLKGILFFIRDTYFALCITILSVKLYEVMTGALVSFGINGIFKGVVTLFIAFVVIDGPNLAERILGVDAGLSSSVGRAMAVFGLARAGARGIKNIAQGAGKVLSKAPGKSNLDTGSKDTSFMDGAKGKSTNTEPSGKKSNINNNGSGYKADFMGDKNIIPNETNLNKHKQNSDLLGGVSTSAEANRSKAIGSISSSSIGGNIEAGSGAFEPGFMSSNSGHNEDSGSKALGSMISSSGSNIEAGRGSFEPGFMSDKSGANNHNGNKAIGSISGSSVGSNIEAGSGSFEPGFMSSKSEAKVRITNPEFKNLIQELKPDMTASVGERKDFNGQVTNIIRGDHTAIKPPENAKAEYKYTNYEKAKQLENVYKKFGKQNENNVNKEDNDG